jgi:hypothetical protein
MAGDRKRDQLTTWTLPRVIVQVFVRATNKKKKKKKNKKISGSSLTAQNIISFSVLCFRKVKGFWNPTT